MASTLALVSQGAACMPVQGHDDRPLGTLWLEVSLSLSLSFDRERSPRRRAGELHGRARTYNVTAPTGRSTDTIFVSAGHLGPWTPAAIHTSQGVSGSADL